VPRISKLQELVRQGTAVSPWQLASKGTSGDARRGGGTQRSALQTGPSRADNAGEQEGGNASHQGGWPQETTR